MVKNNILEQVKKFLYSTELGNALPSYIIDEQGHHYMIHVMEVHGDYKRNEYVEQAYYYMPIPSVEIRQDIEKICLEYNNHMAEIKKQNCMVLANLEAAFKLA